jgi:hypothetical protein
MLSANIRGAQSRGIKRLWKDLDTHCSTCSLQGERDVLEVHHI